MEGGGGTSDGPADAGGGGGPGVDSVDAGYFSDAGGVSGVTGYSSGDYGQNVFGALDRALAGQDLDRDSLAALAAVGLGKVDISPTQNVEQALAARNVTNFMEKAVPAFVGLIPNYGIVSTIGRVGAGLLSGTMTPAQALTAGIAGALGAKTGIPGPVFEGILSGNFGKAAGAGVQGGLTSLANNLTGSPLGGLALNLSGIGPAVNKGVAEAVSGGTGGSRSSGLGAALGLSSAPSQGSSPTGNTYGDAGINADTYSVLAAIEQAAQEPKQPEWSSQMTAGRYGPLMDYQFGA